MVAPTATSWRQWGPRRAVGIGRNRSARTHCEQQKSHAQLEPIAEDRTEGTTVDSDDERIARHCLATRSRSAWSTALNDTRHTHDTHTRHTHTHDTPTCNQLPLWSCPSGRAWWWGVLSLAKAAKVYYLYLSMEPPGETPPQPTQMTGGARGRQYRIEHHSELDLLDADHRYR